jgi:hypothetical protein
VAAAAAAQLAGPEMEGEGIRRKELEEKGVGPNKALIIKTGEEDLIIRRGKEEGIM